MSAVAHLLRRRCSSILQKHDKISSLPSLIVPVQSPKPSPPCAGHRKFSTTTTNGPGAPAAGSGASRSRALTYTTAGAAVLLLSSAAWYVTRGSDTQTQQSDLPATLPGQDRDNGAQHEVDEKASSFVQSHELQEEGRSSVGIYEQVVSNEQNDAEEGLRQSANDGATTPEQSEESVETFVKNAVSELAEEARDIPPPLGPEEDIDRIPPPIEDDSEPDGELGDTRVPPLEPILEYHPASKVQEQTEPSDAQLEQHQSTLTKVVDAVKDSASAVKDYLLNEAPDRVEEDGEGEREEGERERGEGDESTETFKVREMLRENYPDMFYSESDDDREDAQRADEDYEESRILEILENELVGVDRAVPSRLSPSYLVQRGHEESLKRYSEKKREGEVPDFVETGGADREENGLTQDALGDKTRLAEERSKLVGVDVLVGAIQTAKQLQAEADGRTFKEQLLMLQEAHKREVNDFESKIVAYEEGTEQLEMELKKEKEEAAAAVKLAESKAEERLQTELKQKDEAAYEEMERLKMLEKAQAVASLTEEKAEHLHNLHSVQQQVDALRTAFYTRSEEARISHTAHKLAMGAFALEDAIERGYGVEKEADLLVASAGGPGVDPLVDAIVSSIPSDALTVGTGTRAQLHSKFSRLKGSLRELALMPAGGGGVFAHFFARVAANVKISEPGSDTVGSEGIEVVIGKVEKLLADEKLVEAANVLETGARGTAAESLAVEWAKQARNRAITEQGLQALKAHVITVASGLS